MNELAYTLITDGSSDRALIPILNWLLIRNGIDVAIQSLWADLSRKQTPVRGLVERIRRSIELYPCDILFVHRDAEREPREQRVMEIDTAIMELRDEIIQPHICVVPVRMTEAWLLFNEQAIRHASGNRHGEETLNLPSLRDLETLPNPKTLLFEFIRKASGLTGRRLERFPVRFHAYRVPEFISDFSPLRRLPAFASLEGDIRNLIERRNWRR